MKFKHGNSVNQVNGEAHVAQARKGMGIATNSSAASSHVSTSL